MTRCTETQLGSDYAGTFPNCSDGVLWRWFCTKRLPGSGLLPHPKYGRATKPNGEARRGRVGIGRAAVTRTGRTRRALAVSRAAGPIAMLVDRDGRGAWPAIITDAGCGGTGSGPGVGAGVMCR